MTRDGPLSPKTGCGTAQPAPGTQSGSRTEGCRPPGASRHGGGMLCPGQQSGPAVSSSTSGTTKGQFLEAKEEEYPGCLVTSVTHIQHMGSFPHPTPECYHSHTMSLERHEWESKDAWLPRLQIAWGTSAKSWGQHSSENM